jgi:hypothetical protein
MRFFLFGPRILGIRPGISFGAEDFGRRTHRAPAEPMTGSFVYVVRGDHNLVKIGVTTNPRARLASLRTASAFPIDFSYIAVTPGTGFDIEQAAHTMLASHRCNGEWFDVAPEMAVAAIAGAAHKLGHPLLPVTLDRADQILQICHAGGIAPKDDGYPFGTLPGFIKWPLRIILGGFGGVVLALAMLLMAIVQG